MLCFGLLTAQPGIRRAIVPFEPYQLNQATLWKAEGEKIYKSSALGEVPFQKNGPFIAWSVVWHAEDWNENTDNFVALFRDSSGQTVPVKLTPDTHADLLPGRYVSQLQYLEHDSPKFRLQYSGSHKIERMEVHFFDPGNTAPSSPIPPPSSLIPHPTSQSTRSACPCPQPAYQDRAGWCPDGSCPPNPSPSQTNVTHLIVHHSAGTNVASDWAAVVRAIWDFHVNVNGWSDIGYNWLIDPNGVLYEGRGDDILGAHFCGTNGGTMGLCMMGDFTNIQPANQAVKTLTQLLAWKACDENLDPQGSAFHASSGLTLNRISGHRDGCSTSCPGNAFYPTLPYVRMSVKSFIDNGCDFPVLTAPASLAINSVFYNEIELVWEDNSDFESGFLLERSVDLNDNYTALATLPANTVNYSDLTVEPATGYFYRVKAFDATSSSPYSNEVFAVTDFTASSLVLNEKTVRIFPNPAQGRFAVSIENQQFGNVEIALFDVLGRQLSPTLFWKKKDEKAAFEVDISNLPTGLFWVKIIQGEAMGLFKIVRD